MFKIMKVFSNLTFWLAGNNDNNIDFYAIKVTASHADVVMF